MNFIQNHIKTLTFITLCSGLFFSCAQKIVNRDSEIPTKTIESDKISADLPWSQRMLLSEMKRFPEAWMLDYNKTPKWSYPTAIVLEGAERIYEQTGNKEYYRYISTFGETMVKEEGTIVSYDLSKYNIDMLNCGNVLIYLYQQEKKDKYLKALKTLRSQIDGQPRTSEGGFWHKKIYPNQMWLDGLYMGEPFYAHYTKEFSKGTDAEKAYNDIVNQFDLIQKHLLDKKTGLLYHAWDESREQQWADKKTGLSPNFWSRAMGWYGMAMVDVLDYLPKSHPGRAKLLSYLKSYVDAVIKVQDHETGLWYQVLDKGHEKGNYLEATGSSMFVYTLMKSVNKKYLSESYKAFAKKGYEAIIKHLITVDQNGMVNLNRCCAVAGLGGNPYRSGSYDYYINEEIRSNDPKGTGPFILASLEFEKQR